MIFILSYTVLADAQFLIIPFIISLGYLLMSTLNKLMINAYTLSYV